MNGLPPSGDSDLDRESRDLNESSKVKGLKLHDFQMISHYGSGILFVMVPPKPKSQFFRFEFSLVQLGESFMSRPRFVSLL